MNMRELVADVPWWVKWVAVPLIALAIFGGVIVSILSVVVGLLFKVLVFVVVVAALVFVVRKVKESSGPGGRR
ncbi:DUF5326 family protein [Streptomyces sp. SPB074]|uniref:DUF5326 family protein n=1 Tax=Streptomyces sp. (strain SPB074) TaxID=465543 RepID=UPI00017F1EE2|nr:DUF5326 family protein [Streptomyces sp. SPB074]EDY45240.1 membrane spanning protein [Streptomyces sp. SPB074]